MLIPTTQVSYPRISQLVENALIARLADPESGFLPIVNAMAKAASVTLPPLDLSTDSEQLFRIQVLPDDYFAVDNPLTPVFMVYISRTEDSHYIVGRDFSGSVTAGIDILLSSQDETLPIYLQKISNLYTDALYYVFGIDNCFALNSAGISINGGLRVERPRPRRDTDANWVQLIGVTLPLFVA